MSIPDSVTSVGKKAFCGCVSLTDVTLPDSISSVGTYVFADCHSITDVDDIIAKIGLPEGIFYKCSSLTSVTIPESVTTIGKWAFYGCDNLTKAIIYNPSATFGSSVFYSPHPDFTIYGYTGSTAETYASANSHPFVALDGEPAPGDANGDGVVNGVDLANVQRYVAEWDGYDETTLDLEALDLDGDGQVTARDAAILARHLAEWEGYEVIPLP